LHLLPSAYPAHPINIREHSGPDFVAVGARGREQQQNVSKRNFVAHMLPRAAFGLCTARLWHAQTTVTSAVLVKSQPAHSMVVTSLIFEMLEN
jgi:hypothetical protein